MQPPLLCLKHALHCQYRLRVDKRTQRFRCGMNIEALATAIRGHLYLKKPLVTESISVARRRISRVEAVCTGRTETLLAAKLHHGIRWDGEHISS